MEFPRYCVVSTGKQWWFVRIGAALSLSGFEINIVDKNDNWNYDAITLVARTILDLMSIVTVDEMQSTFQSYTNQFFRN